MIYNLYRKGKIMQRSTSLFKGTYDRNHVNLLPAELQRPLKYQKDKEPNKK